LNIVERGVAGIVVSLEAVLEVFSILGDLIDYEPCFLHH
jgi:hypothetical protein